MSSMTAWTALAHFPSICLSQAVLIAPLERATCLNQQSLFSLRITSRSSISSCDKSLFDLIVATCSGLTLQICLIMTLSLRRKRLRSGFVKSQVPLAWSIAFRTHELYVYTTAGLVEKWRDERTGNSSLNIFHAFFTRVVVASLHPPATESMSLREQKNPTTYSLSGPT